MIIYFGKNKVSLKLSNTGNMSGTMEEYPFDGLRTRIRYTDGTFEDKDIQGELTYSDLGKSSVTTGNTTIKAVEIGSSVTSIGDAAFYNCSKLTSVVILNGVTSIGGTAFAMCSSLTSIVIPSSITSINSYAFSICSSLTSITFNKTMSEVSSMSNKYWGISTGAQISCTDGIITITGFSSGTMENY